MRPPLHRFSVSTRKFDCGCRRQGKNRLCSPGRIRPGLHAKRAMKTVCVERRACGGSDDARFAGAPRGGRMRPPLHRFSVSTRKFDCGCRSQGRNGSCSPGRIRPGLRAKRAMKTVCVGAGCRAGSDDARVACAPRGGRMSPPLHRFSVSTRKFDCGSRRQGRNGSCSPGRIRPGLRAKRAMRLFVSAPGVGRIQTMHASLALRGADE